MRPISPSCLSLRARALLETPNRAHILSMLYPRSTHIRTACGGMSNEAANRLASASCIRPRAYPIPRQTLKRRRRRFLSVFRKIAFSCEEYRTSGFSLEQSFRTSMPRRFAILIGLTGNRQTSGKRRRTPSAFCSAIPMGLSGRHKKEGRAHHTHDPDCEKSTGLSHLTFTYAFFSAFDTPHG